MARISSENLNRYLASDLSSPDADASLQWVVRELGVAPSERSRRIVRALAAVKAGAQPEDVSRFLDWKEFESFCGSLFRAKGFDVKEDLFLKNPRAQVDILARSVSCAMVVDCKHWSKSMGPQALRRVVAAQARRADLVRSMMNDVEPIVVVVVVLSNEATRYVEGGAIVPVYALGDFIDNFPTYTAELPTH